jgi:hypothetical protein
VLNRSELLRDPLLALAGVLYLLPLPPAWSTAAVLAWLVLQLLDGPVGDRRRHWVLAALLLALVRPWVRGEMPHPVSTDDLLLLALAFVASTGLTVARWQRLLPWLLPPLAVALLAGPRPWTPNPLAGVNQGAYLLGLLTVAAAVWTTSLPLPLARRWPGAALGLLGLWGMWRTGSRACLVASLLAGLAVLLAERSRRGRPVLRPLLLAIGAGLALLGLKNLLGHPGIGIDWTSDSGRLQGYGCWAGLPFSGDNRLLWGVGFHRPGAFCQQPIHGSPFTHAHNLYLQLWGNTGLLGLLAAALLAVLLIGLWRRDGGSDLSRRLGQAVLVYTLLQGCFDVSMLHWPLLQVLTATGVAALTAVDGSAPAVDPGSSVPSPRT